jgi:hypothetical protein
MPKCKNGKVPCETCYSIESSQSLKVRFIFSSEEMVDVKKMKC